MNRLINAPPKEHGPTTPIRLPMGELLGQPGQDATFNDSAFQLFAPIQEPGQTLYQRVPVCDQEILVRVPADFPLDFIRLSGPIVLKARIVGPENAPVIFVLGGISADRNVCTTADGKPGWWNELSGRGGVLDTRCYRILSFDFFPAQHDLSPVDVDKNDILHALPEYPTDSSLLGNSGHTQPLFVSTADQARLAAFICDYLDIQGLHAFIGASYGGMVALSFAQQFPQRVRHLAVLCAAHRPHPMGMAWRSIQRKMVRFGIEAGQSGRALSLARELGMTTYRTPREFACRFPIGGNLTPHVSSDIEDYLEARGGAFPDRMSPERYLSLSHSVDCHLVDPRLISTPVTLIACRQDQLVPIDEMRLLYQLLPNRRNLVEFDSLYGHDAFLKEVDFVEQALSAVLAG